MKTTKKELVEKIMAEVSRIRKVTEDMNEKGLRGSKVEQLERCLNAWRRLRVVEFQNPEDASIEECEYCQKLLKEAVERKCQVFVGVDERGKWHIQGLKTTR